MWRDPVIEAYKAGVDRSFLKLMDLQRFAAELRAAGQRERAARQAPR